MKSYIVLDESRVKREQEIGLYIHTATMVQIFTRDSRIFVWERQRSGKANVVFEFISDRKSIGRTGFSGTAGVMETRKTYVNSLRGTLVKYR
jgi:hypothetical protein